MNKNVRSSYLHGVAVVAAFLVFGIALSGCLPELRTDFKCFANTDCKPGFVCEGGFCFPPCSSDAECPQDTWCTSTGYCAPFGEELDAVDDAPGGGGDAIGEGDSFSEQDTFVPDVGEVLEGDAICHQGNSGYTIPLFNSGDLSFDSTQFSNTFDPVCSDIMAGGNDIVFGVELLPAERMDVAVVPDPDSSHDPVLVAIDLDDINLEQVCTLDRFEPQVCTTSSDVAGAGGEETIALPLNNTGASKFYYIVVDSFGESEGEFTILWNRTSM